MHSPKVQKISYGEPLDFIEALIKLQQGKKVHRVSWEYTDFYLVFGEDGILKIHKPDMQTYNLLLHKADVEAKDWVVLDEED